MCGLFGFLHYGNNEIKNLKNITGALSVEAAQRGTDATGVAFNDGGKINIMKVGRAAYDIKLKHDDKVKTLIGHTRHSTQGSEKKNFNNHPFCGKCRNLRFALAHNGVIANDSELRKKYNLPKTKIETDSFIAVQLLEHMKTLDENSIKFMAEALKGSFSFSILDSSDTLWLVKGDSPVHILHFPDISLYVYASTEEILWKALVDTNLFEYLKDGKYEKVKIHGGDILKITADGTVSTFKFEYDEFDGCYFRNWWQYGSIIGGEDSYIDDLKAVAAYEGINPTEVDMLLEDGFTPAEIEDYIYCM